MTPGHQLQYSLALSADLAIYSARLVRSLRRRVDTPAGTRVLSLLEEHGPLGVTELARIDGCSQPTMSTAVAALVEAGHAVKAPHPTDARGSVISLTETGREQLVAFRESYAERIMDRLRVSGRSEEELATAVAVIRDILEE